MAKKERPMPWSTILFWKVHPESVAEEKVVKERPPPPWEHEHEEKTVLVATNLDESPANMHPPRYRAETAPRVNFRMGGTGEGEKKEKERARPVPRDMSRFVAVKEA